MAKVDTMVEAEKEFSTRLKRSFRVDLDEKGATDIEAVSSAPNRRQIMQLLRKATSSIGIEDFQSTHGGGAPLSPSGSAYVSDELGMFSKLIPQLQTSYSPARSGDEHTFMLKAILDITEDYTLVIQAYEACLAVLQKRLDVEKDQFTERDAKRLRKITRHMGIFNRIVKPFNSAIVPMEANMNVLMKDRGSHAILYFSDIKSNLSRFLDECSGLNENARAMSRQHEGYREKKSSSVLYALSLITAIFIPAQFLSSVYGMNFQELPELTMDYGYLYFWLLVLVMTTTTLTFYKRKKWI
jgi:Mg2+ and Co2+ transporter CorA